MKYNRRFALSLCFLAAGLGIGTWGANLPALGRRAALSEGEIGLVLLFFAAGAVFAMGRAPWIIRKFGSGRSAAVAAILFGLGIMSLGLPVNVISAAIVATLTGTCFGTLDVTMNNEAIGLEKAAERPIMSSFHAIFSLGTLISALLYAGLVRSGVSETLCMSLLGLTVGAAALVGWAGLRPVIDAPSSVTASTPHGPVSGSSKRPVLMLGSVAFLAFFAEGAILDWIAVFVVRVVGATESSGALSYAVFASAMTLGRFGGDYAKRKLGAISLLRNGAYLVVMGFAAVLVLPSLPIVLISMVFCGIGVANLIPLIFSSAGLLPGADGGKAMSQVMTMGYAGILIGPAIIGFLAELLTLSGSLWLVVGAMMIIALKGKRLTH